MAGIAIPMIGRRFNRLIVLGRSHRKGQGTWFYHVVCDCGTKKVVNGSKLRSGNTQSCGCLHKEAVSKHNHCRDITGKESRTYNSWRNLRQRCNNPKDRCYHHYGGRGIGVCSQWDASFETFLADMGVRPPNTTIDRKDVNGDYCPKNCRWADPFTQQSNKRDSEIDEATDFNFGNNTEF